jgi:hypothetical protein
MRIAIVTAAAGNPSALAPVVAALAKGMEAMGHRVDQLDARGEEGARLPGYDYVAVVAQTRGPFSSKLPEALERFLSTASSLVGKRGAAFLKTGSFFSGKGLSRLMQAMEKEGMRINWSELVGSVEQAAAMGKRIGA